MLGWLLSERRIDMCSMQLCMQDMLYGQQERLCYLQLLRNHSLLLRHKSILLCLMSQHKLRAACHLHLYRLHLSMRILHRSCYNSMHELPGINTYALPQRDNLCRFLPFSNHRHQQCLLNLYLPLLDMLRYFFNMSLLHRLIDPVQECLL